jgi:hypothetical protein
MFFVYWKECERKLRGAPRVDLRVVKVPKMKVVKAKP